MDEAKTSHVSDTATMNLNRSDSHLTDFGDDHQMKQSESVKMDVPAKARFVCQKILNNMTAFVIIYSGGLFFYGMTVSYTNSVLISIERRFGFSTKQIGMVLAATELGHIAMALIVAHFVGTKNRPRWICFGTILMGLAMFLFASPDIIFPGQTTAVLVGQNNTQTSGDYLCRSNTTRLSNITNSEASKHCEESHGVAGPLAVFCIAHVLLGFGSTTPMVLGMPYIDDNVPPVSVPLYFGTALFFRLLGPLVGFGLGAICNAYFHDFSKPSFLASDPRWISAWYIGFLVVGTGLLLFGILIACFPSSMHRHEQLIKGSQRKRSRTGDDEDEKIVSVVDGKMVLTAKEVSQSLGSSDAWKELAWNMKRLLTNFTFICRTSSMFVDGMIVAGFFNYFPKFYAMQFQLTQTDAALYGGLGFVILVIMGVVSGSFVIKKFQLRPRQVGFLLVIPSCIMMLGAFIATGLGCDNSDIVGLPSTEQFRAGHETFNNTICRSSAHCGCSQKNFQPVCEMQTKTIFFSACHAGCNSSHVTNKIKRFEGCSCASELPDFNPDEKSQAAARYSAPVVQPGLCPKICPHLDALSAVLYIAVFFVGLPMSGQVMIQFRIVDVDLKNLCAGVTSVCVAAFGLLPAPIFVGALVDSTCRLWAIRSCGERGACMLYDNDQLRWKFFLTLGFLKLITVILDSLVTWKVWNMEFDRLTDEDNINRAPADDTRPDSRTSEDSAETKEI